MEKVESVESTPTLLQQVMKRHNIPRKELAEALDVPVSALGTKKVAQYAVPLLEEWLEKPPAVLSEVADVMLTDLDDFMDELAARRKKHERGMERAKADMERIGRLFMQHLHALNRLRLEKKALKQMMEAAGEAPFAERLAVLADRETNLIAALKRNGKAAYLKALLRYEMHIIAIEMLDEEEEQYRINWQETHQYLQNPKAAVKPSPAPAKLPAAPAAPATAAPVTTAAPAPATAAPATAAAAPAAPKALAKPAPKAKPISNDYSDILSMYGPEDLDANGRPKQLKDESRNEWKLRIRPYVDAVRKTNKKNKK